MARKGENTRKKERIKQQRRTERKKRDAMTLTAMKSGLIAFGCMFVSMLLGLLWQEGVSPYVTPNNPQSFMLFVGIGFIFGAVFTKRCHDNIRPGYVILRFFSMLIFIMFVIFAPILTIAGIFEMLGFQ